VKLAISVSCFVWVLRYFKKTIASKAGAFLAFKTLVCSTNNFANIKSLLHSLLFETGRLGKGWPSCCKACKNQANQGSVNEYSKQNKNAIQIKVKNIRAGWIASDVKLND